jgi:hypothetical protein
METACHRRRGAQQEAQLLRLSCADCLGVGQGVGIRNKYAFYRSTILQCLALKNLCICIQDVDATSRTRPICSIYT